MTIGEKIIMPLWLKLNFALLEMNQHWLIVSCILTFCIFSIQKLQEHLEYVALVINHYSHSEITSLRSSLVLYHFLHSFATVNLNSTLPFKDNLFTSAVYWCFSSYLLQLLFLPILFFITYDPPLSLLRRTTCVTWSYDSCGRILDNLLFFAPN